MKNQIDTQIKALFKTKGAFYKSQGFTLNNGATMIKSFLSSVERLNKFLKPLGLTIKIVKDEKEI